MEGNCTANADVCLLGALSITILLREAHTLAMEPLLARVALNHKQEAVVSSPADAVLLAVENWTTRFCQFIGGNVKWGEDFVQNVGLTLQLLKGHQKLAVIIKHESISLSFFLRRTSNFKNG